MNAEIRALVGWAKRNGWTLLPTGRGGHPKLQWHDGATVFLPATPSDWRSLPNVHAEMARVSGIRPPKHRSPHFKHPKRRDAFDMAAALVERDARHNTDGRDAAQLSYLNELVYRIECKTVRTPSDNIRLQRAKVQIDEIKERLK